MDVHEPEVRSYNMSRIRAKDTKPEILVRKFLHHHGFRYILHDKRLPGKPDIVLPKHQTVVLVHGCFWHGHKGCRHFVIPKSNQEYWIPKIQNNIRNDRKHKTSLKKLGWRVLTVWECELTKEKSKRVLSRLILKISAD